MHDCYTLLDALKVERNNVPLSKFMCLKRLQLTYLRIYNMRDYTDLMLILNWIEENLHLERVKLRLFILDKTGVQLKTYALKMDPRLEIDLDFSEKSN